MASVRFKEVWKVYGNTPVVAGVDLEVKDGEFLVFVGPSGCGKTTSLRMLAGLERLSYGAIFMGDRDVTALSPGRRDVGMVFQSYALYPSMTVAKNLAFGPSVRREQKAEIPRRVKEVASILGIEGLLDRKPADLSGGQRQRVALGRALIRHPQLFLLDEPLSNLDAALRVQMREEIVRIHDLLSVTTVYVTHDQVEAMTMGDRIAVMDRGRLLQVGTPAQLFENPCNLFVATFVGTPRMNVWDGSVGGADTGSGLSIETLGTTVDLLDWQASGLRAHDTPEGRLMLGLRATDVRWAAEATPSSTVRINGHVDLIENLGSESFVRVDVAGTRLNVRLPRTCPVRPKERLDLTFDPRDLYFFDPVSKASVVERPSASSPEEIARRVASTDGHTGVLPGSGPSDRERSEVPEGASPPST